MPNRNRCLLVNPKAGRWLTCERELRQLACRSNIDVVELAEGRTTPELIRSLEHDGCERLIVCGGDGTLSHVVNAAGELIDHFDWALLPAGTGNDLARSLGLQAQPLRELWPLITEAQAEPIDLVRVDDGTEHLFLNAATGGFGDLSSAELSSDDKERWGASAYWLAAFSHFGQLDGVELTLEHDRQRETHSAFGLAIANGRYVGGGFPIASTAFLNDGLLDVIVVREMSSVEAIAAGVNLTLGRPLQADRIRQFHSTQVRVTASPTLTYSMDGEPTRSIEAAFEVLPAALRIVPGIDPPALRSND